MGFVSRMIIPVHKQKEHPMVLLYWQ